MGVSVLREDGRYLIDPGIVAEFENIFAAALNELNSKTRFTYSIDLSHFNVYQKRILTLPPEQRIDFAIYCILLTHQTNTGEQTKTSYQGRMMETIFRSACIRHIFSIAPQISADQIEKILKAAYPHNQGLHHFKVWHLDILINLIHKQYVDESPDKKMRLTLNKLRSYIASDHHKYVEKDKVKVLDTLDELLFQPVSDTDVRPILFPGEDDFSLYANQMIRSKSTAEQITWYGIIDLARKAHGGKPSEKFLRESRELTDALGVETFRATAHDWMVFLIQLKDRTTEHRYESGGRIMTYTHTEMLSSINLEPIKGIIWMCSRFHDGQTIDLLSKLAERCYKKIPGKGPAAAQVGNACLYTLYQSRGLEGIARLSRLRVRIKQTNAAKLINHYIDNAAMKLGITPEEVEDLAVDDFGLSEHIRVFDFQTHSARLKIAGAGKSELRWFSKDGQEQKSVPSIVKQQYSAMLKKTKQIQKQLDQTTALQRDRLDRMLRSNRVMSTTYFREKYLGHGVLSYFAQNLIFNFIRGDHVQQAIYENGVWRTLESQLEPDSFDSVSLWHPVASNPREVKLWREYLIERQIKQPFKQAFREVYLLTEAELNTRTYSNRMAAHILKQHQYVSLARGRGWSARLIGAWDGGNQDTATLDLPAYHLRVEFWINAVETDNAWNESGIWNYISTDQARFIDSRTNELVELFRVPEIPFSEVMRDIDLFVGVASIGNDPTWQDSGNLPAHQNYWRQFAFGDLSEVAKNRKEILDNLIPRLKIAKTTSVKDHFVVVKGKIRTYKIHIGSTNILMDPNDQYLCIVPDRSQKNLTDKLFIPFDGDIGLSILISKAFMLAEDDKITDPTIVQQIRL